jgi:hypothetical protein
VRNTNKKNKWRNIASESDEEEEKKRKTRKTTLNSIYHKSVRIDELIKFANWNTFHPKFMHKLK